MKLLNRYTGISFIMHVVLVSWLMGIGFSARDRQVIDVYEVSIVASAPSRTKEPMKASSTRYVHKKGRAELKSLGEIRKEKALPEVKHKLTPSKIEPPEEQTREPEPEHRPEMPDAASQAQAPHGTVQAGAGRVSDEAAYQKAVWISQVMSLVQRIWKAPPEVAFVEKSMKTTYILRISRGGELLDKHLLVSSGNKPYDRSVLIALNSIKRFPQPPSFMMAGKDSEEFTMSFTPPKGAD